MRFLDVKLFDQWIGKEQLQNDGVGEIELTPASTAIGLRGRVYSVAADIRVLFKGPDGRLTYWQLESNPITGNPGSAIFVESSDTRIKMRTINKM